MPRAQDNRTYHYSSVTHDHSRHHASSSHTLVLTPPAAAPTRLRLAPAPAAPVIQDYSIGDFDDDLGNDSSLVPYRRLK